MPRGKVQMQLIQDRSKRRASFKQRKQCILKKAKELSIKCGLEVFAVVYEGPDSNSEVFSSVSDVGSLLSWYSSMSKKEISKQKLQKKVVKKAQIMETELDTQVMIPDDQDFVAPPLVSDSLTGPMSDFTQLQDLTSPHSTNDFVQWSDFMVPIPTVPVNSDAQWSDTTSIARFDVAAFYQCLTGSLGSTSSREWVQEEITQVGLDGSNGSGSETISYSLELNPDECIDMEELFDSIDRDSVGSFDTASIGSNNFEYISSCNFIPDVCVDTDLVGSFDLDSIGYSDLESISSFNLESIGSANFESFGCDAMGPIKDVMVGAII